MKVKTVGLMLVVLMLLTACGDKADQPTNDGGTSEVPIESGEVAAVPVAQAPIALTSAGQSADVKMVESLLKKTDFTYVIDTVMTGEQLGEAKTLVFAIGGSSKGLGAAGIDADEEIERIEALVTKAKEKDVTIIGMHIGGEGRRGELSDKFIEVTVAAVDYLIAVEGGNADGFLSDLAQTHKIPYESVDSIAASFDVLEKIFQP